MRELRAENLPVRYVIAGIGEDADYLGGLIRDNGLQGAVHMLGAVDAHDLTRWMNACDVFAMPNREINGDNEGFGMVFIEAAACGKPSLAGEAGGTGSAVLNETTGLRVDGASRDAVTAGLRRLLTDARWAASLGSSRIGAGCRRNSVGRGWRRKPACDLVPSSSPITSRDLVTSIVEVRAIQSSNAWRSWALISGYAAEQSRVQPGSSSTLNSIVCVPSVRGCDTSFHGPRRIILSLAFMMMS